MATENRGFAAANNRGLEVVDAEWVLSSIPDTRFSRGRSRSSCPACEHARRSGSRVSSRSTRTAYGSDDAAISERHPHALRQPRRRDGFRFSLVARASVCSTSSSTTARRAATGQWARSCWRAGRRSTTSARMDERFFLYCEETDFCLRMRRAGWEVVHLPQMTIFHQSSATGSDETLSRQMAFADGSTWRSISARSTGRRALLALGLGYAIRSDLRPAAAPEGTRRTRRARRSRSRHLRRARAAAVRLDPSSLLRRSSRRRRGPATAPDRRRARPADLRSHATGRHGNVEPSTLCGGSGGGRQHASGATDGGHENRNGRHDGRPSRAAA